MDAVDTCKFEKAKGVMCIMAIDENQSTLTVGFVTGLLIEKPNPFEANLSVDVSFLGVTQAYGS